MVEIRDERSQEQKVFGVVPCRFGDTVRLMPTLKRKASREWKTSLSRRLGGTLAEFNIGDGSEGVGDMLALGLVASDTIAEVVLEYDVTGALGGSDWLDEHADDAEIYAVFRSLLAIHFPFAKDVLGLIGQLRGLMALGDQGVPTEEKPALSESPNSPSGPSPSGASDPTKSTSGSTTSN